ncbi:hypothetical protein FCV25MIE_34418 [Fagus crenata]
MDKFNAGQDSNICGSLSFWLSCHATLADHHADFDSGSVKPPQQISLSHLPNISHLFSLISLSHASPAQQIFIFVNFAKSRPQDLNSNCIDVNLNLWAVVMNLVLVVMNLVLTVRVGRESGEGESAKW